MKIKEFFKRTKKLFAMLILGFIPDVHMNNSQDKKSRNKVKEKEKNLCD